MTHTRLRKTYMLSMLSVVMFCFVYIYTTSLTFAVCNGSINMSTGECIPDTNTSITSPANGGSGGIGTGATKPTGVTNVSTPKDLKGLIGIFTNIIGTIIILVFGLTFLAIMWGTIKGWVINGESGEGVESGKKFVTVGIIALVVMSSLWGILHLLQSSFFGG